MDKSDVITLIQTNKRKDEYGRWIAYTTSRDVLCQVDSISQNEFFEAGRNGLNPEFRFTMFQYDYQDEVLVEYKGDQYSVYRTYIRRDDNIELYVERKGGTNKGVVPSA